MPDTMSLLSGIFFAGFVGSAIFALFVMMLSVHVRVGRADTTVQAHQIIFIYLLSPLAVTIWLNHTVEAQMKPEDKLGDAVYIADGVLFIVMFCFWLFLAYYRAENNAKRAK